LGGRTLFLARFALAIAAGGLTGWVAAEAALHLLWARGVPGEGRGEGPSGQKIPLERAEPPAGPKQSDPPEPERRMELGALRAPL